MMVKAEGAESAYLRMSRAIACRETGRLDEMYKWLNEVIRELVPHGFLLPFVLFMHGSRKSPVEEILAEVAPNDVKRYLEIRRTYFANLIRARNHVLGKMRPRYSPCVSSTWQCS